jgi:hypothetical protein
LSQKGQSRFHKKGQKPICSLGTQSQGNILPVQAEIDPAKAIGLFLYERLHPVLIALAEGYLGRVGAALLKGGRWFRPDNAR